MPAWTLALGLFVVPLFVFLGVMRQGFLARLRSLRHAARSGPAPRALREAAAPAAEGEAAPPPAVIALARRCGVPETAPARAIELRQICEIRGSPTGAWRTVIAEQTIATGAPAFVWDAAAAPALRIVDSLAAGVGLLEARLLSTLPMMRMKGPDADRAELLRWLAELPFAPDALCGARMLRWRDLGGGRLEARIDAPPAPPAAAVFALDAAGDVSSVEVAARPRAEPGGAVERPWRGEFAGHALIGGRRIPTRAEAFWLLPDGPFACWRGRIVALRAHA